VTEKKKKQKIGADPEESPPTGATIEKGKGWEQICARSHSAEKSGQIYLIPTNAKPK